jgi:hypothetical protein
LSYDGIYPDIRHIFNSNNTYSHIGKVNAVGPQTRTCLSMVRQKNRLYRIRKKRTNAYPQQNLKLSNNKKTKIRENLRIVSDYSITLNYYRTGKTFGLPASHVYYWVQKFIYPSFHCDTNGGDRKSVFKKYEIPLVNDTIAAFLNDHPKSRNTEKPL